jgi:hypothetical protein
MGADKSKLHSEKWPSPEMRLFAGIGACLAVVQTAERALQSAIETVLDNPNARLLEQSEPLRKQTLGDFLKKLKRRVNLPTQVKDKLYAFLKMRNQLVHDFSEIPGWNLRTEEGREAAELFLFELASAAISITGLCTAVFQVWARDECDKEFFGEKFLEVQSEETRQIVKLFEKQFGKLARDILAARVGKEPIPKASS